MGVPKGFKHSEATKEKIKQRMLGRKFSKQTIKNMSEAAKKLWANEEFHLSKIATACRGPAHPCWGGGITPLTKLIRKCFKYRQRRDDVYTRDDFTCVHCGIRGGTLQADHIKYFSTIIKENNITSLEEAEACDELWNINNGQTLCYNCHRIKTRKDASILKSNIKDGGK